MSAGVRIVDRDAELAGLIGAADAPPALVVVRGRRRVGKTFLMAHAFAGRRSIWFQADEQDEAGHLAAFAREAGRLLPGNPTISLASWDAALDLIGSLAGTGPLVVVLDEFQHLLDAQPALRSMIQRHWDAWDRARTPVTLVLAGSSLTLMERLLDHSSPLFGRAGYRPFLRPLDYRYTGAFTRSRSAEELLRRYGVLGGTPQYQAWAGPGRVDDIVRESILRRDTLLHEEPLHLLRQGEGIRTPGTYVAILLAIAQGATQYNAIAQRAGIPTGNLRVRLERLEDLGYVEQLAPVTPRGMRSQGRSLWTITDPYFRFWFRYVFPNRSRLNSGREAEVAEEVLGDLDNHMGRVFEDCCREWVRRYAPASLAGDLDEVGGYWSRDGRLELDVMGVHRDRVSLLGSCKWRRTVDVDVLDALVAHRDALGPKAADARLMVVAREGHTKRLTVRAQAEEVVLVTATDLFGVS